MKKELVFGTVILIFSFFLISCGESFLLTGGNEEENTIQIISLTRGGIIKKGEILSFKVISTDQEEKPDKLEINLYTTYGDRIGKLEDTSFALNQELTLDLFESISTGLYTLEFILYIGNEVLSEESLPFFYLKEEYAILGIESFPPVVFPGATVLLSTTVSVPEDSDSYLRWTVDNIVISSGLVNEGKDKILWSVPEEEGVYSVKVELFPISPEGNKDFKFSSEIFMDVELYVSESSIPPSRRLYPEESYYSLYHFDGNLLDTATGRNTGQNNEDRREAEAIGDPQLITVEEDFGYYIDNYSGFRINECILPIIDEALKPFTLSMGLDLDPAQKEKNIFVCKTYDNLFDLTVYIDSDSSLFARIRSGSKEVIIPSNINTFAVEYRFLVSLSIVPGENSLTAMWFLDGIQTNTLSFDNINIEISSDGETLVGGENGFAGVLDELGVYYRDMNGRYTINPGLYRYAIRQMYGKKTVFAEGFDGIYLPDSMETGKEDTIQNGRLILEDSFSVAFSPVNLTDNNLTIIIDFDSPLPDGVNISLSQFEKSTPVVEVTNSGIVVTPAGKPPLVLKNLDQSFYIKVKNKGAFLAFPGEETEDMRIESPLQGQVKLLLAIENNNEDNTPVSIDSITVFKE